MSTKENITYQIALKTYCMTSFQKVGDCETQVTNKMQPNLSSKKFVGGHEPMQQTACSSISKGRAPKSEFVSGQETCATKCISIFKPIDKF
jgi:hypothetical protein